MSEFKVGEIGPAERQLFIATIESFEPYFELLGPLESSTDEDDPANSVSHDASFSRESSNYDVYRTKVSLTDDLGVGEYACWAASVSFAPVILNKDGRAYSIEEHFSVSGSEGALRSEYSQITYVRECEGENFTIPDTPEDEAIDEVRQRLKSGKISCEDAEVAIFKIQQSRKELEQLLGLDTDTFTTERLELILPQLSDLSIQHLTSVSRES